ncbi:hypothetical protein [Gloeobacter morelensis]|uniref:Uncharacterized protein n=1 Tax=Gloeobacter morelensis MG652769 TaxID=2781736 RepID=A0ABY3PMF5_9CYAN|nr:hypothetical protein [Gloeobacter morelensis]UFP94865.1 hypothetical protein ISF26_01030 [Gloeobacter morelensis MG652769]
MDLAGLRTNLLLFTVAALLAMLAVGALVVFQWRPAPEPQATAAKVLTLQKLMRQLPQQMQLEQARAVAAGGTSADLLAAVNQAGRIPPDSFAHAAAQADLRRWSNQLLEQARTQAQTGSPRALQASIAVLERVAPGNPVHTQAQAQIRQWRQALAPAASTAPVVSSAPAPALPPSFAPRLRPLPSKRQTPTSLFEDIQLDVGETRGGVTLSASSVRVQGNEFVITAHLDNNSNQRYIFLPGLIRLNDAGATDRRTRIDLSLEQGIIPPEGTARLSIHGRGPWEPPYRIVINENRISGTRDFNLPVMP